MTARFFLHSPLSLAEFLFPLPTELHIDTLSCRIRLQGGYRGNVRLRISVALETTPFFQSFLPMCEAFCCELLINCATGEAGRPIAEGSTRKTKRCLSLQTVLKPAVSFIPGKEMD